VVQIDSSLGWTFVAVTGRGTGGTGGTSSGASGATGRGGISDQRDRRDAASCMGDQEFFFAQPDTGLVYFGRRALPLPLDPLPLPLPPPLPLKLPLT
jgi:hypothetical protein